MTKEEIKATKAELERLQEEAIYKVEHYLRGHSKVLLGFATCDEYDGF